VASPFVIKLIAFLAPLTLLAAVILFVLFKRKK
jgi:hypothetical protein